MVNGVFREDVMCCVRSLQYDFISRVGRLEMDPLNCTDMTGAIALFVAIDPDVKAIHTTYSDEHDDTFYTKRQDGTWFATMPSGLHAFCR